MRITLIVIGILVAFAVVSFAAPAPLPQGTAMLAGGIEKFQFSSDKSATSATFTVKDQPFTSAMRVQVSKPSAEPWNIQLLAPTSAAVKKGDVLLASVWLRGNPAAGSTEAQVGVIFQRGTAPFDKSLESEFPVTDRWQKYDFPFVARQSLEAGKAQVGLFLGFDPELIDIGEISVTNFGDKVSIKDLPITHFSYPGHEPDALWRKAAEARIEKIRKGDLTITVLTADGKPVAAADVSVKMTRHAFAFGSAVAASELLANSPDAKIYQDHVVQMFNRVVMENDLKWPGWNSNRDQSLAGVKWLRDRGIEVRGHNLIWPSWANTPKDLAALKNDPDALPKRIADHITDEVSALRGQLCEWDVINEPYANHDVLDILGQGAMIDWFKLARAADPDVKLFINDYPIPIGAGKHEAHWDAYEKQIRALIDGGAPLDGIGIQSHFGAIVPPPQQVLDGFDRMAAFGKEIEATEFDIDTQDEQLQADYTRDFLTAAFSHPSVNGILMWGFWEGRHWIPNAALFRKDWSIKPNGQAWMDLVMKKWWTTEAGKTDAAGQFKVRGFLGEYEVKATVDGVVKTAKVALGKEGASVTIK